MANIKILLVEDNQIVRDGLKDLLHKQADMEVAGDVGGGRPALDLLEAGLRPDIILADLNMPQMDGVELTRRVLSLGLPVMKVIILTMHTKQAFVDKAFEAGAKGYLLKDGDFQEMYQAIRLVNGGSTYVSAGITS